jgi:hypothetical protein
MNRKHGLLLAGIGFLAGGVTAQTTSNWITDILLVYSTQSEVVRHPTDKSKYYLCWNDGVDHFGVAFRRSSLDLKLRSIALGGRAPLTSLLPTSTTGWTAADEKICWPNGA